MRYLATNVVLLALASLQPAFSQQMRRSSGRRHLRRRYLPSDLDDARETDDTIEWDDTTIEDDTRVVGPRWRRHPYGVIDDDGWAGDGAPVDPGAELALVLFLVIVIFWLAVGSAFAPSKAATTDAWPSPAAHERALRPSSSTACRFAPASTAQLK